MTSIFLRGGTIMSSEGELNADMIIKDGRIQKILKRPYEPGLISQMGVKFSEECDISGKIVFPGLIDCHVHFREPGLEHKETMETGAAAALAGGVTTVCEMPNMVPPTVTVGALEEKVRRANGLHSTPLRAFGGSGLGLVVDIRFFFGATEPQHLITFRKIWLGEDAHLRELRARCCGLKLYFDHSTGDQKAPHNVIEEAFKMCGGLGAPVVCHCEDARLNAAGSGSGSDAAAHSLRRPPESEVKAVKDALALAKKYGTKLHIAHLSTKSGLDLIRKAKADGITVTCEVAPHHLFLTADDYAALGTLAKMNPPLRTREHQEALWGGIADRTVDCIATDHAPHTLEEKKSGDPLSAPSGVPGVETMLPLLLTVAAGEWPHTPAANHYPLTTSDILRLCFANPNRIFNLGKQGIIEGAPTNIIIVDPKAEWVIKGKELHSKCGWTPYEGWNVRGKAETLSLLQRHQS